MFDYIQKFNQLPRELREKVSSPATVVAIDELEKKYGVNLAALVMKVMVKEVDVNSLAMYFVDEFKMEALKAERLAGELKEKIFAGAADYLGIIPPTPVRLSAHDEALYPPPWRGRQGGEQPKSPQPPLSRGDKAVASSFFFSPEDEKEIRELTGKIGNQEEITTVSEEQIKEKLDKIVAAVDISFGSELLAERFRKILYVYLKGIRDRLETKEAVMKSFAAGGLGFDVDSAEKVLTIADDNLAGGAARDDIKPLVKIKVPEDKNNLQPTTNNLQHITKLKDVGMRDFEYDLSALANKEKPLLPPLIKGGKLDTAHELSAPSWPPPEPKKSVKEIVRAIKEKSGLKEKETMPAAAKIAETPKVEKIKIDEKIKPVPAVVVARTASIRTAEPAGKVKMEDIKAVPRVMNPIDELRFMNLLNFRRLDRDPAKATAKIREKISLLEEEDYGKRLEGIKAWRSSPVNRVYLKMGEESISEGKPIDVIIEKRKTAGEEYLTNEEFKAVMDLNRDLRF